MIFKDQWYDVAEPNCQFNIDKTVCECEAHKKLRKFSKATTFGIFYGIGPQKLGDNLNLNLQDAKELIANYYLTFPGIKDFFDNSSALGIANNQIRGLDPYNRIRFYNYPENEKERAAIGRQSKNYLIQNLSAEITKLALIKIRKYILQRNLEVYLHLAIHDEILTSVHRDYAETWKGIQEKLMIEAAVEILPIGKFAATSSISDKWQK